VATNKLSAAFCKSAGPGKHGDGAGLMLVVDAAGRKKWVLRIVIQGKRRDMGLGAYPEVGLAKAREVAEWARDLTREGKDPIAERARIQAGETAPKVPPFRSCAADYIESHRAGWRNAKHAAQWEATLTTYAFPTIGDKAVSEVGTDDVLEILSPIWSTKTETAKRVQGRVENVLDWAKARGHRAGENPARWRGHLDKLLPRPTKVKRVRHHAAMDYREVPAFVAELQERAGISIRALELTILTACRTGEVIGARWPEIDLDAAVWTIPASRMKANRQHRVPLSGAAVALLEALPCVEEGYVFPSVRYGKHISQMAMLEALRGMRPGLTVHGFRSSFRDWCAEQSSFPREVAEAALAHVLTDKTEAAYQRGDLFEKRRKLMEAWARYCTTAPESAAVVPIRKTG